MESFGKRIARLRENVGLSQSDLARAVGVKPQSIQAIESGKAKGSKHVVAIAKKLNVSPDYLQTGRGAEYRNEHDDHQIIEQRHISEIAVVGGAGLGGEAILENFTDANGNTLSSDAVLGRWGFPDEYLTELRIEPNDVRIIEISGDSMRRPDGTGLHSGDRVMVWLKDRNPTPPGIFALWDGFGIVVKRLERIPKSDPPAIRLISDNPVHTPYELTGEEVNIIGRLIWTARRL